MSEQVNESPTPLAYYCTAEPENHCEECMELGITLATVCGVPFAAKLYLCGDGYGYCALAVAIEYGCEIIFSQEVLK